LHHLGVIYSKTKGKVEDGIQLLKKASKLLPQWGEGFLDTGNALMMAGKETEALEYYEQAESVDPENPALLARLGIAYFSMNRLEKAALVLSKAIHLSPNLFLAHFFLGKVYEAQEKLAMALDAYKEASLLQPNDIKVQLAIGEIYEKLQDYEKAESFYQNLSREHSNEVLLLEALAKFYERRGRFSDACEIWSLALSLTINKPSLYLKASRAMVQAGKKEDAEAWLNKALQEKGKDWETQLELGLFFEQEGKNQEAISAYTRAIELNGECYLAMAHLARLLLEKGNKAKSTQLLQEARILAARAGDVNHLMSIQADLEKLSETKSKVDMTQSWQSPSSPEVLELLKEVESFLENEKNEDAFSLLQKIIAQDSKNAKAYYLLGKLYGHKRLFSLAMKNFQKALELSQAANDALAQEIIKKAMAVLAQPPESIESVQMAKKTESEKAKTSKPLSQKSPSIETEAPKNDFNLSLLLELAEADWALGKKDKALSEFRQVIARDPENIRANLFLGKLSLENEQFEEALPFFQRVLEQDKENGEAFLGAGKSLLGLNREEEAFAYLSKAYALLQDNIEALLTFVKTAEKQKAYSQAKEALEKRMKLFSDKSEFWLEFGKVLILEGKIQEGIQALKKSIGLQPTEEAFLELSKVYESKGNLSEAIKAIQKGLKQNPTPFLSFRLWELLVLTGDKERGIREAKNALRSNLLSEEQKKFLEEKLMHWQS